MRIATYNVEWFDGLFDDDGNLVPDDRRSARYKVTRAGQIAALGRVFRELDADAVMVVEAPDNGRKRSSVKALETFARHFDLRATQAVTGFKSDTQQEITFLFDPSKIQAIHDPQGDPTGKKGGRDAPRFDSVFRLDLDIDADPDQVRFSKPPLELAFTTTEGRSLRLIGVHVKSKAPHGATTKQEIMRRSIANRRKQLAQCIWIRQRVQDHLDAGDSVIVMGDFNDGPGLDEYEKLFGRSGVEIVLGEGGDAPLFDPHARFILTQRVGVQLSSARFYIHTEDRYFSALLDYIMVSPDLRREKPQWKIWHPFDDPHCYYTPDLRDALLDASDHFPVSIDLPTLV